MNIAQRLKHFDYRQDWLRDLGIQYYGKIKAMLNKWARLGIISKYTLQPNTEHQYLPSNIWVETDRERFDTVDPTFEQVKLFEDADENQKSSVRSLFYKEAGIDENIRQSEEKRRVAKRDEK